MQENFQIALEAILRSEGFYDGKRGWMNDPNDNGGPTLAGITYNEYCRYVGRADLCRPKGDRNWDPAVVEALKAIPDEHIAEYYRSKKWNVIKGDALPSGVDIAVADVATLHGPGKAAQFLREAIGYDAGTTITDHVAQSAREYPDPADIVSYIAFARRDHYDRICAANPSQKKWLKGWKNRTARVEAQCLELCSRAACELTDYGRPEADTVEAA